MALSTTLLSLAAIAVVPPSAAHAVVLDPEEAALCSMVNAYRAQNGLAALKVSTSLTNAAEWLSTDMAAKNYFSHTDSLGRNPSQRMAAFGYTYATPKAENIAAGSSTAAATIAQWKASPDHNTTMLSASYRVMGIGRAYQATAQYDWYWTNTFGGYDDGGVPCPSAALPALSVADASVTEGNTGTRTLTFTVARTGDTTKTSSVRYATANGTATAGIAGDYVARPLTTLSFAAGETAKPVIVTVNGDLVAEATETFYLQLSSPVGATISDASATGMILNDDSATTLAVDNVRVTEGHSGTRPATFTVTRSGVTSTASSVRYATMNGTATAGSDYVARALTTVNFAAGETAKSVAVTVIGDMTVEPSETFFVKLSSPTGATILDNTGAATIVNDDAAPGELPVE